MLVLQLIVEVKLLMLKRLFIIGVFTGLGQLLSIVVIKYIAAIISKEDLAFLGSVDSVFQLCLNLIAMGLQSSAMRDIALSAHWQEEYRKSQEARISMGVLIAGFGIFGLINPVFYTFLLAPVLAMSGDYALYATGRPVGGSIIAFIRLLFPYLAILIAGLLFQNNLAVYYTGALFISYLATNWIIASQLGVSVLYRPDWRKWLSYFSTIHLGFVNLSLYFIGLGVLLLAPYLFSETVVAVGFVGLKFYVLVKGVLRIIHQAFMKEMRSNEFCLRVDKLSLVISGTVLCAFIIFPKTAIGLLFGDSFQVYREFFVILAVSGLIYSFNLSATTRALLEKADKKYAQYVIAAALVAFLGMIFLSKLHDGVNSLGWAILAGETIFAALMAVLIPVISKAVEKLQLLLTLSFFLIPGFFLSRIGGDNWWTAALSLAIVLGGTFWKNNDLLRWRS